LLSRFLTTALLVSTTAVHAADVTPMGADTQGTLFFKISGDLAKGDAEKFLTATDGVPTAVILLQSDGGDLQTGLDIGSLVRMRGYGTAVMDGESCYSSCALAWLGGTKRIVGVDSQVSFHAAYVLEDGNARESGVGNALVGAYLSKLGLKEDAVVFLTSAPPDDFNELDADWSASLGIDVEFTSTLSMVSGLTNADQSETAAGSEQVAWEDLSASQLAAIALAAGDGDVNAQWNLGYIYLTGKHEALPKDVETAVFWLTSAAENGHARAQFFLYLVYRDGDGVPKDADLAGRWLVKASEAGVKAADEELAEIYMFGGVFPADVSKANIYLQKLAQDGDPWAQVNLGIHLLSGKGLEVDEKGAAALFRKAAESGYPRGQLQLGWAYLNATGVPVDYQEAAKWLRMAAEADDPDAQYSLALMYEEGQGVQKDPELSAKWMSAAAVNGHGFADYFVAKNFSYGNGVARDDYNAANFILKFLRHTDYRYSDNSTASEVVNKYNHEWTPATIAALQETLAAKGYYKGAIDGSWGPSTAASVEAFYLAEAK
jgi:TPR repeat protein